MTKVLLTGATGYVGGEVLYNLTHSSLDGLQISSIVRSGDHAKQLQAAYPNIRTVVGDLDDVALVKREAESADIVLHLASTSHVASAKAIADGLQARSKNTSSPHYWIQISGATCYAVEEISSGKFGFASDEIFDDTRDQEDIVTLLRKNTKRVVENTVLSQSPSTVKTALIIGPLIYGAGRGPVNQRSVQAPEIVKTTLKLGHGFKLNKGQNIWSNIHVQDLAYLVHSLVSAATNAQDGLWNHDGVYNAENGKMTFEHLNTLIANEAHKQGLIKQDAKAKFDTIDAAKADAMSDHAAVLWGTNARTVASKARQKLAWRPSAPSLEDTIPDLVHGEAEGREK
ncbi:nucleoside-diphosphate-sugar epimerase [Ophiobolus disseminans]|uniref:Nucleoside-diphosphate-sugar epimerase n=1 Tax=Ophiobolus disseminans TaxID=1469910 RepID=A0A6A6ZYU4_9PLEO|nr:nucleoside-diphosphate-sugar epimerase [Ophiobolus disseminans]